MKKIYYRMYERDWKEYLLEVEEKDKWYIIEQFNLYKKRGKDVYLTYLTEEEVTWGL